jgi:hypothetical protein
LEDQKSDTPTDGVVLIQDSLVFALPYEISLLESVTKDQILHIGSVHIWTKSNEDNGKSLITAFNHLLQLNLLSSTTLSIPSFEYLTPLVSIQGKAFNDAVAAGLKVQMVTARVDNTGDLNNKLKTHVKSPFKLSRFEVWSGIYVLVSDRDPHVTDIEYFLAITNPFMIRQFCSELVIPDRAARNTAYFSSSSSIDMRTLTEKCWPMIRNVDNVKFSLFYLVGEGEIFYSVAPKKFFENMKISRKLKSMEITGYFLESLTKVLERLYQVDIQFSTMFRIEGFEIKFDQKQETPIKRYKLVLTKFL